MLSADTTSGITLLDGASLPGREQIGGKAWSIARMAQLGLPVPPAFVVPTEVNARYAEHRRLPDDVWAAVRDGIAWLEEQTGKRFGGGPRPLLVSVRSGAAVSMPGMMDTVLNLGINDDVEAALAAESGDPAYANSTHRRFVAQYARIVLRSDAEVSFETHSVAEIRELVRTDCGQTPPTDPFDQLRGAIEAVFKSWQSPRARAYRRHWKISESGGTAVTVQAMVFGNVDDDSGTGVLFTRNPLTGDPAPYGEYLPRGQGEDVVSGEHDPFPLDRLEQMHPDLHAQLLQGGRTLEVESRDVQDIEFTIERGRLYFLQARSAKRSPEAAVRLAVDLASEGVISPGEAVARVTSTQLRGLLRPRLAPAAHDQAQVIASGEAACPGVATGVVVVSPDEAEERAGRGEDIVLARPTTSPDDVHGMIAARAVITELGGSTSHAAVVSRALGRPCIVGCGEGALTPLEGEQVTIEGALGKVYRGRLPTVAVSEADDPALTQLIEWAAHLAPLEVYGFDDEPPADVVDLDEREVVELDQLADAVRDAPGARGRVLENDEAVRVAVAAGLRFIVVEHRLPALLASLPAAPDRT